VLRHFYVHRLCCVGLISSVLAKRCAFSALMLLDGWQEGYPARKKTEWWDAGMVICLGQGADLHMAQLMPLPLTISCCNKSRLVLPSWFIFLVPAYTGSPGQNPRGP